VVGSDKNGVSAIQRLVYDDLHARVGNLHGLFGCLVYAGMPNHVAVREVYNDEIVFTGSDFHDGAFAYFRSVHFRMFGESGRIPGAFYLHLILVRIRASALPVEKRRNVFEFLRLSQPELP